MDWHTGLGSGVWIVVLFNVSRPDDYVERLGGLKVKSGFAQFISVITVEVSDVFDSFYGFPDDVGIMWQLLCLQFYLS